MRSIALLFALLLPSVAFGQEQGTGATFAKAPPPGWPSPLPSIATASAPPESLPITAGQPPAPPVDDGVPVRVIAVMELPQEDLGGQQHRFAINFALGQPSVGRVSMRVLTRESNSLWIEAYGGSALFNGMFGFGARIQHTAMALGNGDTFFISPGLGVQILPNWYDSDHRHRYGDSYDIYSRYTSLSYIVGDVDFSWLHDFSPRFGFELGIKLGLAGRVSGNVGNDYPRGVMLGKDLYPIIAFYSGFRF